MKKNRLIIVEGPQGAGKTTITNAIREKLASTNLIRMSGVADKEETGKEKSYRVHMAQLSGILDTHNCDINYVLDRSIITEAVYGELGFKKYPTIDWEGRFEPILSTLNGLYDMDIIFLAPNRETLSTRLKRDKAEYQKFSVESSLDQINGYERILNKSIFDSISIKKFEGNLDSNKIVQQILDKEW